MEVLIVVPTYNEVDNLVPLVGALLNLDLDMGLLVVDDGSPDGTGEAAEGLAAKDKRVNVLQRGAKMGLGSAYSQGFSWGLENTQAPFLVQMDADFSHDPAMVPVLLEAARPGMVAVGSRYVPGGGVRNWSLWRRMISRFGCLYAESILDMGVRDATSGFKCWPRQALQAIDLNGTLCDGYAFQIEMSWRALKAGFSLKEVPITFVDRGCGQSKMSTRIAMEAAWKVWYLKRLNRRLTK
ncbi:MAG: polyprenol monophosphomannose synthase [Desulfarculaceae bacterium]|jgi:dolichol-phosphate mannosyltransferase